MFERIEFLFSNILRFTKTVFQDNVLMILKRNHTPERNSNFILFKNIGKLSEIFYVILLFCLTTWATAAFSKYWCHNPRARLISNLTKDFIGLCGVSVCGFRAYLKVYAWKSDKESVSNANFLRYSSHEWREVEICSSHSRAAAIKSSLIQCSVQLRVMSSPISVFVAKTRKAKVNEFEVFWVFNRFRFYRSSKLVSRLYRIS